MLLVSGVNNIIVPDPTTRKPFSDFLHRMLSLLASGQIKLCVLEICTVGPSQISYQQMWTTANRELRSIGVKPWIT